MNQKSRVRNISKRSSKRGSTSTTSDRNISKAGVQQTEESIPEGWQRRDTLNEGTLPTVQTSWKQKDEMKTHLFNGFFQRESEGKEKTSGNNQERNRTMKYWVGTKTYPLVDHSIKQEEKIVGPQQHQSKLPWWTGIYTAIWLLWTAIIVGIYPICQAESVVEHTSDQARKENQIKEKNGTVSTEQSGFQAPSKENKGFRPDPFGKSRGRNLDTESRMC